MQHSDEVAAGVDLVVVVIHHSSAAIVNGNVIESVTEIGKGNVIGSVNGSATGNEIVNAIDMEAVEEAVVVVVEAVALLHVLQQALVAIDAPPAAENVTRIVAQPALEVVVVEQLEAVLQHPSDDAVAPPRHHAIPSQVNRAIGPWIAVPAVHATW